MLLTDGTLHRDWVRSPSGLILSDDAARLRYAPKRHPQGGDIFAGCGGFSCGAKQAGIHMRFAVEYWPTAAVTYMINLGAYPCSLHFETEKLKAEFEKLCVHKDPKTGLLTVLRSGMTYDSLTMDGERRYKVPGTDHMWVWDVRNLTGKMLLEPLGMEPGELDFLHGSPPCQGFSTAGKKSPHDPRNLLMLEYARLITEIRPKAFTMEQVPNVLNMTTPDGQPMMDAFIETIEAGAYASRKAIDKMLEMQGGKHFVVRPTARPEQKSRKKAGAMPRPLRTTLARLRAKKEAA